MRYGDEDPPLESVRVLCSRTLYELGSKRLAPLETMAGPEDDEPAFRLWEGGSLLLAAERFALGAERQESIGDAVDQLQLLVPLVDQLGGVKLRKAIDAHHGLDLGAWGWPK